MINTHEHLLSKQLEYIRSKDIAINTTQANMINVITSLT